MTLAARFHVLRCKGILSVRLAWRASYCTCVLWKVFHTYHMQFKSWSAPQEQERRAKFNTKASGIGTCVDLRQPQVETVSGRNKKKENPQEWFTLGSHLPYLRDKVWPMAAVTDCLRNFRIIMTPLDLRMFPFCRGWPLNLSAGTCATQERQRVTSFCRTANPIMDSVCAFAIFGKCQQRR